MKKLLDWFDDRTGIREVMNEALYERIPGGARWRYVWGSTLVFTFFLQVITGIFLWTAYSPSTQTAWESVYYIQSQMTLGWLIRGMHHFAAQAMVVLLAFHLLQVIIDGAYKAPREINFWLGIVLMGIVLGLSLTGYLLPWDQKGYYATKVATNIMGVTPVIGTEVQEVVQGGSDYGHQTLTRFFALHAGILPGLLIAFLALHIAVFRRHGIHAKDPEHAPEAMFWPDQVLKDAVACLAVLAVVMLLAIYKGAELSAPADPSSPYDAARPEWYFLFLFRFLKFEFIDKFGLAFGAIYIPSALMLFLIMMPIIALWRFGHKINVFVTVILTACIMGLTGLAFYEDWYSDKDASIKFRNDVAAAHKAAERVRELAEAPSGIPPEGAVSLLRNDPLTQGPKIFAKRCASCHRYDGHDGTGELVMVEGEEAEATAADLGKFGSRQWVENILVNYDEVFAPTRNTTKDGVNLGELFLDDEYGMAGWVNENKAVLQMPENKEILAGLKEFLAAQSGREDLAPYDESLIDIGRDAFVNGTLNQGEFTTNCVDCHDIKVRGEEEALGFPGTAPVLTGYAGEEWLKSFISNPGTEEHYGYGDKNAMPAFEDSMSERELDLLVKWMINDYYKSEESHSDESVAVAEETSEQQNVEVENEKSEPEAE
ncbi:MAG: cytochrome b N-terminal domain-containing protein [Planctomycetaceae bacterium]|nr:cytochrome b N-terminal domain-containing protein [Planctomycetaceae bacterium]